MKRTGENAREYYNSEHGHRLRVHMLPEGVATVKLMKRGDVLALPSFRAYASFEDAIRHYTRIYGAWERVEYRVGSIGW